VDQATKETDGTLLPPLAGHPLESQERADLEVTLGRAARAVDHHHQVGMDAVHLASPERAAVAVRVERAATALAPAAGHHHHQASPERAVDLAAPGAAAVLAGHLPLESQERADLAAPAVRHRHPPLESPERAAGN